MPMLLWFIIVVVVIGVGLYLVNTYVPMQAQVKHLLNVLVIVAIFILFVWMILGSLGGPPHF